MKGFERLHVKSAVKAHSAISLSSDHLTTLQIGQIVPLYCTEVIPGDKFDVKANYFSRMAPLVRPTYGKFDFKTVSVFVPYHQVAYDFEAFRVGKNTWEGITPDQRYIYYTELINFMSSTMSIGSSASDYDFSYVNASGTTLYRKFDDFGRYAIKILNSLGYVIPQNIDLQTTSTWYTKFASAKVSAMPLLAFAKAYNDYMSQSQRFNTSSLTNFLRCVKLNISVSGYASSTHSISSAGLGVILSNIKLCYDNDYFTSSWQNPNAALNALESNSFGAVPATGDNLYGNINNDYLSVDSTQLSVNNDVTSYINQRSLDFLRAFDDWVRRNNYSGSRDVQQIYSRFGIKVDDYRSHFAHIITTDSMNMQVGDVTATTVGTNQALGDYAGKAIISGSKGFKFDASDFGMLFVIGYITVKPMYAYGFDRSVLRVDSLDFYTPEFDGLGADAISYGEVYTDPKNQVASDTSLDDVVFGFTERYNSYRFGRDKITGDFRKYENSAPENNWHCGRLLTAVRASGSMVAQSSSMNTLPQYTSEFARIFSVTSGVDQFYMTCQFDVKAIRPIMSLNQVPRLGEGSVDVPRNGNEIN